MMAYIVPNFVCPIPMNGCDFKVMVTDLEFSLKCKKSLFFEMMDDIIVDDAWVKVFSIFP